MIRHERPPDAGLWLFALLFGGLWREDEQRFGLPRNELGEECPFPFDPPQLAYQPIGQYHCEYCGAMVLAGVSHLDYGAVFPDLPDE